MEFVPCGGLDLSEDGDAEEFVIEVSHNLTETLPIGAVVGFRGGFGDEAIVKGVEVCRVEGLHGTERVDEE
jgi:hypothetical protein